ncbi:MAG: hypothetical protein FJ253_09580 [Phycisphaerae bacterium]|nr:hypothetical protein [Phycisphaerae bacterium]
MISTRLVAASIVLALHSLLGADATAPGAPAGTIPPSPPTSASPNAPPAPADSSETPAAAIQERPLVAGRLERWLADGDKDLIVQSFRRHPNEVLPFVDQYLERGLKLLEGNASDETAMNEFRKGVKFAQLATDALRDPIFVEYAGSFASWNETERTRFREGQKAARQGALALKKGDAATALERYAASQSLAEPLGDSWGLQMALAGQARSAHAMSDWARAAAVAAKAMEISGRLQLRNDEIETIVICAESRHQLAEPDAGLGYARLAWSKLRTDDSEQLRRRIAEVLVAALEAKNFPQEAAKIRSDACLTEPSPKSPPAEKPAPAKAP